MSLLEVPFEVVVSRDQEAVVVTISGELDTHTAPRLRSEIWDLANDQGNLRVVVNLERRPSSTSVASRHHPSAEVDAQPSRGQGELVGWCPQCQEAREVRG